MKSKKHLLYLVAAACTAVSLSSCIQAKILSSIHQEMEGSLDLLKLTEKGPSFDNVNDQIDYGYNVMYLVGEGFFVGGFFGHDKASENNELYSNEHFSFDEKRFFDKEPQSEPFYLSEGIGLINKVTKATGAGFSSTSSLVYLQVPVMINYNHPVSNDNAVHVGIGPYAAVGLFGKLKSGTIKQNIHFGSSQNDDLKRMDYGVAFNAGYRFLKKWDVTAGYDLGLRNVSTTPPDPDSHIRGFSFNVGYWFK